MKRKMLKATYKGKVFYVHRDDYNSKSSSDVIEVFNKNGEQHHTGLTALLKRSLSLSKDKNGRNISVTKKSVNPRARRSKLEGNLNEILCMYIQGETLQSIGDRFECTRENIRLTLNKFGINRFDGGAHVRSAKKSEQEATERLHRHESRVYDLFGCELRIYEELSNIIPSPVTGYISLRSYARAHDIDFDLTLEEFWRLWDSSGHWKKHGNKIGEYCICRKDFTGGFSIDNVYIDKFSNYVSEYQSFKAKNK